MYNIIDVAQYIFDEYKRMSGKVIDEMKLHKLLYFTQRESIAITGEPMFLGDFSGWIYGPVSLEVRQSYSDDGMVADEIHSISIENEYIAKSIIIQYGGYESWKLSEFSHCELSWKNSRKGLQPQQHGNEKLKMEDIRKDAEKVRPYDPIWDMYYDEFEDVEVQ